MKNTIKKLTLCVLISRASTFVWVGNSVAKTEIHQALPVAGSDRITAATKHKILKEKVQPIVGEAVEIESDTQKAIVALENKDSKGAITILQGVSSKLDGLLAKNPGLALVPANIEADVFDFKGNKKTVAQAIDDADSLLRHGKLQGARQIVAGLASEIRISTTSIPLGTFPAAIKQAITLIESGKIDQAVVDLDNVLDTLDVTTEIMPLPVLRAEELLTLAAELEHRDDLSKEQNRKEIRALTDAAKDKLELAQLLGYGDKKDYKVLYDGINGIDKELFSDQSAAAWQKIKDKFSEFKDRLKALGEAAIRAGHPAK
ncbi:YfdX family protein [Crenothrix sp.]|uniref:YfdX family protein n=1 Tax=Crenothrix sp. TaxID=3100433 RepID=UPI00374CF987